jgi:hypothetical protein
LGAEDHGKEQIQSGIAISDLRPQESLVLPAFYGRN